MYKSIMCFALIGSAIVASVLEVAAAPVLVYITKYENIATGFCLDSNNNRQVYTLGCNGGKFQEWI